MNAAIIGATRRQTGIGEHIARYFHKNGVAVKSILGSTEKTTQNAAVNLKKYGIEAKPYIDLSKLIKNEKPQMLAIASPSETHHKYLIKAVNHGINVLCEKPFIWKKLNLKQETETILKEALKRKLTVSLNSQLPFSIKFYERLCGKIEIKPTNRFFMAMSPFVSHEAMIPESLPHPLSILYFVYGKGQATDLNFEHISPVTLKIKFKYTFQKSSCDVLIKLTQKKDQPRELLFGFNDKIINRVIDLTNYDIYYNYETKRIKIDDPLELSVKNFIESFQKRTDPAIGPEHIISNITLLEMIYNRFKESCKAKNENDKKQRT